MQTRVGPNTEGLDEQRLRVLLEALNNVGKHARAENVTLRLAREHGVIRLEVSDDGRGFDPERPREGYGLLGMAERTQLLGGSLRLSSEPGAGTAVSVTLPLSRS
jgi:signal transduction histidine kinase